MVAAHRNRPWQVTSCLCECHYTGTPEKHEPTCGDVPLKVRSPKRRLRHA